MSNITATLFDELKKRGLTIAEFSKEVNIPADRIYSWKYNRGNPKAEDVELIQRWLEFVPREKTYLEKRLNLKNWKSKKKGF